MRFRCVAEVREDNAGAVECVEVRWNEMRILVRELLRTLGFMNRAGIAGGFNS